LATKLCDRAKPDKAESCGTMTTQPEILVQDIDHLGIIAGIIDEMGLVEEIDRQLGTPQQQLSQCRSSGQSNDSQRFGLRISPPVPV